MIQLRTYGNSGRQIVLLHGGPGASGYMAPIARQLADAFRVLEPLQRGSGAEPLTVARHAEDLHEVVGAHCGGEQPALVGHSWGAMLALASAATHPDCATALVLIGCGTFDPAARTRAQEIRETRMDDRLRQRIEDLPDEFPDPDEQLRMLGNLFVQLDSCELVPTRQGVITYDARAHHETWEDMLRLQEEGIYPAAFAAIDVPVLMLHGAEDPHPGEMIRASLVPHLPQLEYREWERCGHYPWLEKAVRDQFFAVLRKWLRADPGQLR